MSQPGSKRRMPTQYDIASHAGVSQTTVSQVLNNKTGISIPDETRQRILRAVQELGYVPDRGASSLRTQKTYTIAVIIPDITNPFYPSFIRGIQDIVEAHDYDLVSYNTDGIREKEAKCLNSSHRNRVDGIIAVLFNDNTELLQKLNIHVVKLDPKPTEPHPFDILFTDGVEASRVITSYLVEKGYSPVAMIAGVPGTLANERMVGYKQALREHNIHVDETLIKNGYYAEKGGYEAMQELLAQPQRPRAVFAANDLMAMGAMIAIHECELRIPKDIAIAGFDDIPSARLMNPPLTTINQFQQNLGRLAAEMLFERICGSLPEEGRTVEAPFELVIRESA